ncbi:MAG: DNA-processing protein DprA, partial [Chloroflexia bacterium]|nr:DNA-processing protein DprA [Chloroflexia bacterium]
MEKYYLAFNLTPGIGPVRLRRLLEHFGSPQRAWQASAMELRQAGLESSCIGTLLERRRQLALDEELARVRRLGVSLLTWESPDYPERLRHIYAPPPVLYLRGSLQADEPMVAIVGTRRPSAYGREVARRLAAGLARAGVTVVSGLALGVDAEAHRAALEAGGRSVAVLGAGVDHISPQRNRRLGEALIEQGGLLSDYPLGTAPEPRNFPPRNRIISGLT